MIKIIIFDADGTLYKINKDNAYEKLYSYLSQKLKVSKEKIKEEHQKLMKELKFLLEPEKRKYSYGLKIFFEEYNFYNPVVLNRALELFWNQIIEDLIINPEAIKVFEDLKKKFKLVIASDEFIEILNKKLNKVFGDWKDYFIFIVTPESVNKMKPSKKYYEIILEKTETKPEETLVIGDSWERDLEPAKSLRIKTILISNEKNGEPDFWIRDIKDILEIVENL
jgi:putative hydrolase of the HAD superfamily